MATFQSPGEMADDARARRARAAAAIARGQVGSPTADVTQIPQWAAPAVAELGAPPATRRERPRHPRIPTAAELSAPHHWNPEHGPPATDAAVSEIITDALNRAGGHGGVDLDQAWGIVQGWREQSPDASQNLAYAAADHYFMNRDYAAGGTWVPALLMAGVMLAATPAYDVLKYAHLVWRSGGGEPSEPSAFVRGWAYQGITDGLQDWGVANHGS